MVINMNTTQTTFKSIDIHAHILFGIDHGSHSFKQTKDMLDEAKKNNITDIICTPHFKGINLDYKKNFTKTKTYAKKIGINIYSGNELMLDHDLLDDIKENKIKTLNNSKYLLIEVKRNNKYSFKELCEYYQIIINLGYKVIIAHPELIKNTYKKTKELMTLKNMGIMFQTDAESYYTNFKYRSYINKLIKLDLLDFVASDIHYNKKNSYEYYNKFYHYLNKKYGKKYANKIYYYNPKKIIENK